MLRERIREGLRQEDLDKAVAVRGALSQDTAYVLGFFILKHVFAETSAVLEGEAVGVDRGVDF